ncbi:MAG TPA: hypothetical protein VF506_11950 [Streptosporangiaceae bacterium]
MAASCVTSIVLLLGPLAPASLACQIVSPAQAAATTHARKGVSAWVFNGVNRALIK